MLKPIVRKKRNYKNLALPNTPTTVAPPTPSIKSAKQEEYDQLYKDLNDLEIGLELRLDLREEDIKNLEELGAGNGGTVYKVLHIPSKRIMAKKVSICSPKVEEPAIDLCHNALSLRQYIHNPCLILLHLLDVLAYLVTA